MAKSAEKSEILRNAFIRCRIQVAVLPPSCTKKFLLKKEFLLKSKPKRSMNKLPSVTYLQRQLFEVGSGQNANSLSNQSTAGKSDKIDVWVSYYELSRLRTSSKNHVHNTGW